MATLQADASRRRAFSVSGTSFSIPSDLPTACANLVDGVFYILGIFLVCFASVIIAGLTHSFFVVVLPMIQRANPNNPLLICFHVAFVAFVLINVLTNYYLCISAKHKGRLYDTIVRELADTMEFAYPETPQDVLQFKRDFEEKMIFRLHRRQARQMEANEQRQQQQQQQQNTQAANAEATGVTQRKVNGDGAAAADPVPAPTPVPALPVRRWLIMAPDEWGFCDSTNQPKPPRSHFDHVTRQLVLNMDHYCPWMFNTVGYFNYRYFCNFLLFVVIGMAYGACLTLRPFLASESQKFYDQVKLSKEQHSPTTLHLFDYVPIPQERSAIAFSFILCLSVGLAVLLLASFHAYLLLTAQTTIEFHVNCANRRRAKQLRQRFKNPYDLGMKRNFQQVYGTGNPLVAIFIPSNREPEFLPLPLLGKNGLRPKYRGKKDQDDNVDSDMGVNIV